VPDASRSLLAQSFSKPYPLTAPMVVLLSLPPFYIFIGASMAGKNVHAPLLALDRAIPLQPVWAIVYGTLLLFIVLPFVILRDEAEIRRTSYAYLLLWLVSFAFFFAYPTAAPHPPVVAGSGFSAWLLQRMYDADTPYNCFPSLHVAQSCLSAIVCHRVNRRLGAIAGVWAALIAVSTLFTKQHYVADVLGGVLLAAIAWLLFLRGKPRDVQELDRRAAPVIAATLSGLYVLAIVGFRIAYAFA